MRLGKFAECRISCFALCLAVMSAPPVHAEDRIDINDYLADRGEIEARDLVNEWWRWVYSIPEDLSPITDVSGADCGREQTGEVWFLAHSKTARTVERRCEIPAGAHIFFPIISNLIFSPPVVEQSCDDVKYLAAFERDPAYVVTVALNGSSLTLDQNSLIGSAECFDIYERAPAAASPGAYFPSATDGYWALLKPPPIGDHLLEITARYHDAADGKIKTLTDIRYHLAVRER